MSIRTVSRVLFVGVICTCFRLPILNAQQTIIRSEDDLAIALRTATTKNGVDNLLNANSQFITEKLWQRLMDLAATTYYQNHDQSFALYDLARRVAEQLRSQALVARTYYNVARSYSGLREFEKAKEAYFKSDIAFSAAALQRDRIYVLSDLGTISLIQEQYAEAKTYSEASIRLADELKQSSVTQGAWPDAFGVASALSTLAELAVREGNIDDAIRLLKQSVALYEDLNRSSPSFDYYLADSYAGLGRAYTSAGDNRQALLYLNKSVDHATRSQIPNVLNSIGFLYMEQENYAQATAHYLRTLKLYQDDKNSWEAARVLMNLAVIEQRQNNLEPALRLFRQSLAEAKSIGHQDVLIAAFEGIGVGLSAQGLFNQALNSFSEAFVVAKKLEDKRREAEILWRESETLFSMEDYERAAARSSAARDLSRECKFAKLAYLSAITLGLTYAKQGKLDLAIETLKTAVDEVEDSRTMVAGTEEQFGLFFEKRLTPYHALIDLLLEQGKTVEALLFAEQAKARVLLDVVRSNRIDLSTVLSASESENRRRLNERIFVLNEQLRKKEAAGDSVSSALELARLEYQAFEDSIYVSHPELLIKTGRTVPLTEADVTNLVSGNVAFLEYVVTKNKVLVFVLSKSRDRPTNIRSYTLAVKPQELEAKVNLFHDRLANRHPNFSRLAHEFYDALIGPAESQLKGVDTICIVPDSLLWNLPFQALMSASNHYLVEDHALFYAPSLTVLRHTMTSGPTPAKTSALIAFGNPSIEKGPKANQETCPLPEAEAEVTSIATAFDPSNRKVFIGPQASESNFRSLAPAYSTIHLATHGVLDNREPLYSHLLLTKTEGDVENDGLVEAREILNMNLRADLAVLSACETANGRIAPGEGVIGMSWAFLVAGTRSLVVSQWKVNSVSTSKLMKNFYQPLVKHRENKAQALRAASLRLLKDTRYRHPFYWAAFVLVGNN